jgi:hypothetical protein
MTTRSSGKPIAPNQMEQTQTVPNRKAQSLNNF